MKNALGVFALALSLGPAAGCVQGDLYGSSGPGAGGASGGVAGTGCGFHCHPATAVAASGSSGGVGVTSGAASGSTTGSATTGGTTTGGGSSGSLPFPCADMSAPTASGACQSGEIALSGQAVDLLNSVMGMTGKIDLLAGVGVGAFGCPTAATLSNSDGGFALCVTPSVPISPEFTLANYVTLDVAELDTSSSFDFDGMSVAGGVYMISDLVQVFLNSGTVTILPDAGAVIALVESLSGAGPCLQADAGVPADYSGWTVTAQYTDGRPGPWPVGYLVGEALDPTATATSAVGVAIIYNIGPETEIKVIATRQSPDPAGLGSLCPLQNSSKGFTGKVQAAVGNYGYYPILVP